MGVHRLWKLLETTGRPINPETLEGKILAVDVSLWLHQAVKGVREREGVSSQNAHLLTLFHRICKLLYFGIRPVFVFDGDSPPLKNQTLALRRQRREEASRESKQTTEKLLQTFLRRRAITSTLVGPRRKDLLPPTIYDVRRDESADIYALPPLPPVEGKDESSSEEEEMAENYFMYQEELYQHPNLVDINSDGFASLPPEMKHEILKDMQEFSKRRRTSYHKPPEQSGEFSQYQLAGLLQRNQLNQRLEKLESEMGQQSAGWAPDICGKDLDHGEERSVESRRLVSEVSSHYILIKGSRKSERAQESRPAAPPWSGGPLSWTKRDRPEPLWRPVTEEDEEESPSSVSESSILEAPLSPQKNSVDCPSPCTLKAIQAAMNDNSDEEAGVREKASGCVSPRSQLAIQRVFEDDAPIVSKPYELPPMSEYPAPQLILSSLEEEKEADDLLRVEYLHNESKSNQTVHTRDDKLEEATGQRDIARSVASRKHKSDPNSEDTQGERESSIELKQTTQKSLIDSSELCKESEGLECGRAGREDMEHDQKVCSGQSQKGASSNQHSISINLSAPPLQQWPMNGGLKDEELHPHLLQPHNRSEDRKVVTGCTEDNDGSNPEEIFIKVSDGEESIEEDTDHPFIQVSADVHGDEYKEGREQKEPLCSPAVDSFEGEEDDDEEEIWKELEDRDKRHPTVTPPAISEWEDIAKELEVQQNILRERQRQQERMAATVTGRMFLESQELLHLFGVPYVVAPMEAEAQCAVLDHFEQTHGTVTDDSDIWLFGARHVYRNFFRRNKHVEHYQYMDLHNQLGLDRTKLINLAYLLGSDYTDGIAGVGCVTAMEILNEFPGPGMEPLANFSKWWLEAQKNKRRFVSDPRDSKVQKKLRDLKLPPSFPDPAVAQAYLHPAVEESGSSFSWGRPHLDLIKEFCQSRFGWSGRKTEETLQPVIKRLGVRHTQPRIDSFFRVERQERQSFCSQRLQRAVTCLKRKAREEKEVSGGKDDEEVVLFPSKLRKVKKSEEQNNKLGKKGLGTVAPMAGGGFFGLPAMPISPSPLGLLKDVSGGSDATKPLPTPQVGSLPKRTGQTGSFSSDEDSDEVAMVTARSVFEDRRRSRGGTRVRGRGKGRVKKL